MILPLFRPVSPGDVVGMSVPVMGIYRKYERLLLFGHARGGVRRGAGNCGPAGIRTQDQGIRVVPPFPAGADYLFTRGAIRPCGCGTLLPVIKGTRSPQVVSAPSGGVPPARLRIAISRTRAGRFP